MPLLFQGIASRSLEADWLTLVHLGLITSHRDPDHLAALGVLGEHLHHPLRAASVAVHLLHVLAEVLARLRALVTGKLTADVSSIRRMTTTPSECP